MTLRVVALAALLVLAGCSAPTPDQPSPTASPSTTATPADQPGPLVAGVGATVENTTVGGEAVVATVAFTNHALNESTVDVAVRYVENASFAMVGTLTLAPNETQRHRVPLPTYGADPANLTVQVRINGSVVAERPVLPDARAG